MAIHNIRDVNFTKLKSLKKDHLTNLCDKFNIQSSNNITLMISDILNAFDAGAITTEDINQYIKNLYSQIRQDEIELTGASHELIVKELNRVDSHVWGMVQGAVDSHIQSNYVRRYYKYDEIVGAIRASLYNAIESYTICTWYNHWSTVFLEDLICLDEHIVPIIKKVKGVDVIWNEQPIDIKVTNLPREWFNDNRTIEDAIQDPSSVCEYLYRLQGEQRFGCENRLFIIIYDTQNPENSWQIKRDYDLIKKSVKNFFGQNIPLDPINFSYKSSQYLAHAKVLFIIK